ncbi:MAG: M48 family metalloprotease [Ghiorsea sp.]
MDFFEHKADAKRNTLWLYLLFAVAVFAIVVAVYIAASASLYVFAFFIQEMNAPQLFWELNRFIWVSAATTAIIVTGSWYKVNQLKKGGGVAVAQMLGGLRLRKSQNPIERQLRNVIEEMAVASGVLTPAIFILEQRSINAFAAGYGQRDTAIAVTRGAIEMLSRDELQGVIAHEFSHVLHGDTLIKMKMMGLLHGITMISDLGILMIAGRFSSTYSHHKRATHPLLMLSGLLFFTVGLLGILAADFIKAAMSRQREFLADASAVQFTRNPEGIGNALKVIGGYKAGSRLNLPQAQQVSHLFFGEALQVWWQSNWWASHPPLLSRIQRIEPRFRGRINRVDEQSVRFQNEQNAISHFSPPPNAEQLKLNVNQVMASIGEPDVIHLVQAQHLLQSIPDAIHDDLSEINTAKALLYCLLIDENKGVATKQFQLIPKLDSSPVLAEVIRIRGLMPIIKPEMRLPMLDLVSPHLGELGGLEQKVLLKVMKQLIAANENVSLFEYLIYQHMLYLFGIKNEIKSDMFITIERFKQEVLVLLSLFCTFNQSSKPRRLFQEASAQLFSGYKVKFANEPSLNEVTHALEKLNLCSFEDKKRLLQAVVFCVLSDGVVSTEELETMRLVAMLLHCPMPTLSV